MSVPMAKYKTGQMKRTLQTLRKCASLPKSRPANQRLGVQNAPILTLDPERVVIDELHLRLRIGDVLVRNLVWEIVDSEGADLSLLESCIRQQCSVSFRVWEARDPDGKPSGKYDWTSLQGEDMKKLISLLPPHFSSLLRSEICQTMANIWKVM